MKSPSKHVFTAYVGIDWADKKHDVCVQPAGSETREFSVVPHKVDMINDWAQSLIQRFGSPIAVAVELSKGPLVYALQKFDCFVIYPINPFSLARYRERLRPAGQKMIRPMPSSLLIYYYAIPIALNLCNPKAWKCGH